MPFSPMLPEPYRRHFSVVHARRAAQIQGAALIALVASTMVATLPVALLSAAILPVAVTPAIAQEARWSYPATARIPVADTLHGVVLSDPFRWLEDSASPEVRAWDEAQNRFTRAWLDSLPQRARLVTRFDQLLRYDDEFAPDPVPDSPRLFYWVKRKDKEKAELWWKENAGSEGRLLLDPNTWAADEMLDGTYPSRDGRYLAYGQARGGNENPVLRVLEIDTGRMLPDTLRGWFQSGASWLPGNRGFYYSSRPRPGEVPPGEEHYWTTAWLHILGEPAAQDRKVFFSDTDREAFHWCGVTEDGKWAVYYRSHFNENEVYFGPVGGTAPPVPLATGMDAQYSVSFVDDTILIRTDKDAPRGRVWMTTVDRPEREQWRLFLPEDPKDRLLYLAPVAGRIYATYLHQAHTQVRIHDLSGTKLRDLPFPTLGSGWVGGLWSRPEVWAGFTSYTVPSVTWLYHFDGDSLQVYHRYPVPVDTDSYLTEQVWYPSRDGTQVSMFVVRPKDRPLDGSLPLLLSGYGGFDVSETPQFSASVVAWLEAGGAYAAPNLRGGGEYGRAWHEAGMREKKQNVFDDFLAAAEWLIQKKYTRADRLAIWGGSNGGLLMGAAVTQRPDLFRAVGCSMPLLDMIRYHRFGLANIWAEEYGSAEDKDQFAYLRRYSPYHRVLDGAKYPAILLEGSENDSRVDPLHARKMAARLQEADQGGGPVLLLIRRAEGHLGGAGITKRIEGMADTHAFLMSMVGL